MFKWILFTLLSLNLFALEISMDSAKDNFTRYATLHLSDKSKFLCQEIKNDFRVTTEIICAFSKRPLSDIAKLQNDFFKVSSFIKKDTFFIKIKPFHKIKLIANIFDLTEENSVYKADVSLSKRWIIVGYKNELPLMDNRPKVDNAINFPFFLDADKLPYVGSLDIKGNPVHIQKVGDVTDYLRVKKLYKEKKYERCMDIVEDVLLEYPNTLFKAEFIYYKIKIYAKLKDYDNVISNAKIFLREYSSSDNIAEVLSLIAQAYSQIGMNIDADYFFDRLFSEHKNSVFTHWGYVYKGKMLELSAATSQAIKFYKKALYTTKDLEVAATAAYNIAKLKIDATPKEAQKYIDKILVAKPSYFKDQFKESSIMMHSFADENYFITAAKIAEALLDSIDPSYDEYELLLSERGLWLALSDDKKLALEALNTYLRQFPDGDYIDKVQVAKDGLFFDTEDKNTSKRLAEYDKLIETYKHDTIGNRAIYEKAKLLLMEQMYTELLEGKDEIENLDEEKYADKESLIRDAAIGVMKNSLKAKECNKVLKVSHEYNITLSDEWDDGVYECAMKGGDFSLGKSIANKNLKSSNLEHRKKWLFRYIKVDFATGNYSDVIEASQDLVKLIEDDKTSKYKEVYRYLFDTYERLERKDEMLESMAMIENVFGLDYRDIERYVAIVSLGNDKHDDNMVIKYASKVMRIEQKSNSHVQSPYIEFTLYQAYINLENYNKALDVIASLDSVDLKPENRSRQKYLKGVVLNKLWRDEEASVAYDEAIQADGNSAWAKLATNAKEI